MEIIIDRKSVCMGDDVVSHKTKNKINKHITFLELFSELIEKNYFPHIQGNDVVWVLRFDGEDRIAWKTKKNKFYEYNKTCCSINKNRKRIPEVTFIYYSSTKEWTERYENYLKNKVVQISCLISRRIFLNSYLRNTESIPKKEQ